MPLHRYAIAIGSNRWHGRHGAPRDVVRASVVAMERNGLSVSAHSPIMLTAALGPAGRSFANAAIIVSTELDPPALLRLLKTIERAFGRRRGRRWGSRVLDLDIALWSGGRHRSGGPRLTIPHRELEKRLFVLVPLLRIAPDWRIGDGPLRVRHAAARLSAPRRVDRHGLGQ